MESRILVRLFEKRRIILIGELGNVSLIPSEVVLPYSHTSNRHLINGRRSSSSSKDPFLRHALEEPNSPAAHFDIF